MKELKLENLERENGGQQEEVLKALKEIQEDKNFSVPMIKN